MKAPSTAYVASVERKQGLREWEQRVIDRYTSTAFPQPDLDAGIQLLIKLANKFDEPVHNALRVEAAKQVQLLDWWLGDRESDFAGPDPPLRDTRIGTFESQAKQTRSSSSSSSSAMLFSSSSSSSARAPPVSAPLAEKAGSSDDSSPSPVMLRVTLVPSTVARTAAITVDHSRLMQLYRVETTSRDYQRRVDRFRTALNREFRIGEELQLPPSLSSPMVVPAFTTNPDMIRLCDRSNALVFKGIGFDLNDEIDEEDKRIDVTRLREFTIDTLFGAYTFAIVKKNRKFALTGHFCDVYGAFVGPRALRAASAGEAATQKPGLAVWQLTERGDQTLDAHLKAVVQSGRDPAEIDRHLAALLAIVVHSLEAQDRYGAAVVRDNHSKNWMIRPLDRPAARETSGSIARDFYYRDRPWCYVSSKPNTGDREATFLMISAELHRNAFPERIDFGRFSKNPNGRMRWPPDPSMPPAPPSAAFVNSVIELILQLSTLGFKAPQYPIFTALERAATRTAADLQTVANRLDPEPVVNSFANEIYQMIHNRINDERLFSYVTLEKAFRTQPETPVPSRPILMGVLRPEAVSAAKPMEGATVSVAEPRTGTKRRAVEPSAGTESPAKRKRPGETEALPFGAPMGEESSLPTAAALAEVCHACGAEAIPLYSVASKTAEGGHVPSCSALCAMLGDGRLVYAGHI